MRNLTLAAGLLIAVVGLAQQNPEKENPGSLFKPGYVNPLTDKVARQVGDILTVVIDESTVASYSATTQTSKSDSGGFTPAFVVDLLARVFRPFSASATAGSKGDGKTDHKFSMKSTMSVVVKQVLPNGNLVVEGNRSLTTNKDTETIVLSGMVRPFDIAPDNTVKSTQIAEAKIAVAGKGAIQDRQRKGLINQLLDWLF